MQISVVVCCYNSASRIRPTLEHLAKQELKGLRAEVILVDNNCSDNTVSVAKNTWENCGAPYQLRIIQEKEPGLSHARKAGVMAALGEIVVFCDDDNWLKEDYFSIAYDIMKNNSEIGVLGGRSEAVSDIELPFWFTTYQGGYAVGVQSMESGDITRRGYIWGAGMILRRAELHKLVQLGFKNILSDRIGSFINSGGDSEICKWFLLANRKLFYEEKLIFKHFIPISRLTMEYMKNIYRSFSESKKILKKYEYVLEFRNQSKWKTIKRCFLNLLLGNFRVFKIYLQLLLPRYIQGDYEIKQIISAAIRWEKYHLNK